MRRTLATVLVYAILLFAAWTPQVASAEQEIKVLFNGEPVLFEVPPLLQESRTFVPVRFVLERIKAEVTWDGEKQEVGIVYGPKKVVLTIGSRTVLVNGKAIEIDVAPFLHRERTMVPLRFVAETFGFEVQWDPEIWTVLLIPPSNPLVAMMDLPVTPAPAISSPVTPAPAISSPVPATSSPVTPAPAISSPVPGTSSPVTPAPATSSPVTPAPATSSPVTPAPATSSPVPGTSSPVTPAPTGTAGAVVVSVPDGVRVGEEFTVTVNLQNVSALAGVSAYLRYDATKVEALQATAGNTITGLNVANKVAQSSGRVEYVSAIPGLNASFSGSGLLLSVQFRAKAPGQAAFWLEPSAGEEAAFRNSSDQPVQLAAPTATLSIQ